MRLLRCGGALACWMAGSAFAQQQTPLARKIAALMAAPAVVRDHWGVAVYSLDGKLIYGLNEGQFFQPASNAKLFTTAAALAVLGENATAETKVTGRGIWTANALNGDLRIIGGADANLSGRTLPYAGGEDPGGAPALRYLEQMADAVAATGLKTISGDILGDDTLFPWEPYPIDWAVDDLVWGYGAPVSALTVNDNQIQATVAPAAEGAPATITLDPPLPYYTVVNQTVTGPAKKGGSIEFERVLGSKVLRVYGTIAADDKPDIEEIAINDPAEYAAIAFKAMLETRGITVQGVTRAEHRPSNDVTGFTTETHLPLSLPGDLVAGNLKLAQPVHLRTSCFDDCSHFVQEKTLATYRSVQLSEDIVMTNKVSQNLHAELLLHRLGEQAGNDGSTAQGVRVVRAFLLKAGIQPEDIVFFDGSGMSGHDLITPRAAAGILLYAASQTWGPIYRSSLPVGGVDGTLEHRFTKSPLKGKVFAKTGTTGESRALSGYLECASGKTVVFSVLVGNHPPSTSFDRTVMDQIVEAIAASN